MLIDPSGETTGMAGMLPFFKALPFYDLLFRDLVFSGIALLIVNGITNLTAAALLFAHKKTGDVLGGVFGAVVIVACITGLDAGGAVLWQQNPWMTALICLLKGVLAGLLPGLVAAAFAKGKHPAVGCWIAGLLAPIVNTGIFLGGTLLVFRDVLLSWASANGYGSGLTAYIVFGLLGVNFLIEFALNAVFAPAIVRIVQAGHTVTHRAE